MRKSGSERLGTELGRYRLVELLGSGGVGTVYRAVDATLERAVAVKILHEESRLQGETRARFRREARLLSQLEHNNVCRVFDFLEGEHEDVLVLELIDGHTLSEELRKAPSFERRLEIAIAIADVLCAVHERGVLHRDLKPQNVMVQRDGTVKVLDFGLARVLESADETLTLTGVHRPPNEATEPQETQLTRYGGVMGTPSFMSPEQARGEELTPATDLYSFGLLLLSLFSSQRAHPEQLSSGELLERSRQGQFEAPEGMRSDLQGLALRMLSAQPSERPTAEAALAALRAASTRNGRYLRRAVATAAVSLLIGLGARAVFDLRAERSAAIAAEARATSTVQFFVDMLSAVDPARKPLDETTVKDLFDRALQDFPESMPEDFPTRAAIVRALGEAVIELGLYDELERLLEYMPESTDDPELIAANQPLHPLRAQNAAIGGDYAIAEDYARRHLAAASPEERSAALVSLANQLKAQEEYDEALEAAREALEEALALDREPTNRSRSSVTSSYVTLGNLYFSAGDSDAAKETFEAGLAYAERHFDRLDLRSVSLIQGLTQIAMKEGRKEDSVEYARQFYEAILGIYGADHPNVAVAASNYAGRLGWANRHAEAVEIGRKSLDLRRRLFGDRDLRVAYSLESTGWSMVRSGQIEEGQVMLEEALDIRLAVGEPDAEALKIPLRLLGFTHRDMTFDYPRAESYFRRQLTLAERRIAKGLPSEGLSNALSNLAVLYHRAGWVDRADAAFPELLEVRVTERGEGHRHVVQDAWRWVDYLRERGREAEALNVMERFDLEEESEETN
ncbi:MAG: serine/threonine-protein kinase [Acidobacteriota bacterium]